MSLMIRACALILRIAMYYSPVAKRFSEVMIFNQLPYSLDNLAESKFLRESVVMKNSEIYFNSELVQHLLNFIQKDFISILFFSLLDICIGISLTKITNNKKSRINYLEMIYLFNPISILNCIKLKLDIFYIFINLMFILNRNSFLGSFFFVFGLISSPGHVFINISYTFYLISENKFENFLKFSKNSLFAFMLIFLGIYLKDISKITDAISNFSDEIQTIYFNYYSMTDTHPNVGMLWSLIPETFLKFRNFSCLMLINYQILFNVAIISLMKGLTHKNRDLLCYSLLFLVNHIIDRYPCENHFIIAILLIVQNIDFIQNKVFPLAVICSFAGYTLILSRGFHFRFKRTGTSNFLFFQNLTYDSFLIFVLLMVIFAVFDYKKTQRHKKKIKSILDDIIEKVPDLYKAEKDSINN